MDERLSEFPDASIVLASRVTTTAPNIRKSVVLTNIRSLIALIMLTCGAAEAQSPMPISQAASKQANHLDNSADIQKKLMDALMNLNHPKFGVRTQSMHFIHNICASLLADTGSLPPEIESILRHRNRQNREQCDRLDYIEDNLHKIQDSLPDRISPGKYGCKECISLIEAQTGFRIDINKKFTKDVLEFQVPVMAGENDCLTVLQKISDAVGGCIDFDNDTHVLLITPKDKANGQVFGGGKFIGLLCKDSEIPENTFVKIRFSPYSGMPISLNDAATNKENLGWVTMAPVNIPKWTFTIEGGRGSRPPEWQRALQQSRRLDEPLIQIEYAIARKPITIRIECDTSPTSLGWQNIYAITDANSPTKLLIHVHVTGNISSSVNNDGINRDIAYPSALVDANRYNVFDESEHPIKSSTTGCTVNGRRMQITLACEGKASSIRVTGYTEIFEETTVLALPKDTQKREE